MSIHLAYPNVIPREGKFVGCGRYIAAALGAAPDDRYALVELNIPNITEVHVAALQLAPETVDSKLVIYERKDVAAQAYVGESKDLAYVLALISRSRTLRFPEEALQGDVWCTGRIDIKGDQTPFLKAVDATGFVYKLEAFLAETTPDRLFVAPAANILPVHEALFHQRHVQVVSVAQFQHFSAEDLLLRKTIVKVRGDELEAIVKLLFLQPMPTTQRDVDFSANPYRGLFAFREQDAALFFGRDPVIRQCVEALNRQPLLALIGSSGSGKSSLLYAGVIPHLRQQRQWQIVDFRPGADPFYALATGLAPLLEPEQAPVDQLRTTLTLADQLKTDQMELVQVLKVIAAKHPDRQHLLLIDQFEELYTLCHVEWERRRFLEHLVQMIDHPQQAWRLTLAIRADFLGKVCAHRSLADALQQATVLLGPMTRDELRTVIEQPAERCGILIEDGLTERILEAVGDEPGNLPLLSFALTKLWETQQAGTFTHAAYNGIGGVQRALALYAEQVYKSLETQDQAYAQRIFTQLIRPGEGTEDTRRSATRAEVGEKSWALVTELANARLVVTSASQVTPVEHSSPENGALPQSETVELVHEALIQAWQRLREWIDADRQFRMWQERLRSLIRQWEASHHDESACLRGVMLLEAEQWLATRHNALSSAEQAFIDASLRLRDRDRASRARQRWFNRLAFAVGFGVVFLFAVFAGYQWRQAERHRRRAEEQTQLAYARQVLADQQRRLAEQQTQLAHDNLQQAELNAVNALTQSARALLLSHADVEALLASIKAVTISTRLTLPPPIVQQIRLTLYAVLSEMAEVNRFEGHRGAVKSICFSSDGRLLASGGNDGVVKLWNVVDGRELLTLYGHLSVVKAVAFQPSGTLIASGGGDPMIHLWEASTGQRVRTLISYWKGTRQLQFSPDGQRLVALGENNALSVWNVADGRRVTTPFRPTKPINTFRLSPTGDLLATGNADYSISLWDMATGQDLTTFYGHTDSVQSLSFSPDGQLLASGSADMTVKLWYVTNPAELVTTLQGHTDGVRSVIFSPDGALVASGSDDFDRRIIVWDVQTGLERATFSGHYNSAVDLAFSPDGKLLASASDDYRIKLWKIPDQHDNTVFQTADSIKAVAFHPNGAGVAFSGKQKGTVTLWNRFTRQETVTLYSDAHTIWSLAVHPDGTMLAAGTDAHTIVLWDLPGGRQRMILRGHTGPVRCVRFSPDGRLLASSSADQTVKLWDVATGQVRLTLTGHKDLVSTVAFHPDGALLASASEDATVKIWQVVDGREMLTLTGHDTPVRAVVFHPQGRILASGSGDNTIKLWTFPEGQELATLKGHARTLLSLDFSADGAILASGSQDHAIKLWSIPDGHELTTLHGHTESVLSLQFSPRDLILVSGGDDHQVKVWDFEFDHLLTRACESLQGYLLHNPYVSADNRRVCIEALQRGAPRPFLPISDHRSQ